MRLDSFQRFGSFDSALLEEPTLMAPKLSFFRYQLELNILSKPSNLQLNTEILCGFVGDPTLTNIFMPQILHSTLQSAHLGRYRT